MDGTSERVRDTLDRRARPKHLIRCAELAKAHGMDRLKLYLMVGTPGETDADIDECVAFTAELSRILPLALGIAPFCPKRNTPLDAAPFAGIRAVEDRLDRLRRGLRGRVGRARDEREMGLGRVRPRAGRRGRGPRGPLRGGERRSFRAYERAFEGA